MKLSLYETLSGHIVEEKTLAHTKTWALMENVRGVHLPQVVPPVYNISLSNVAMVITLVSISFNIIQKISFSCATYNFIYLIF